MAEYGFLPEDKNFSTRAITTRFNPKQWDSWCVVTPVVLSTTFLQSGPDKPLKYTYGRSNNPTREILQEILAALENAKYGFCFSSGLGCVTVISHLLKAGDHLLTMGDLYGGVYRIFNDLLPEFGIQIDFIDLTDVSCIHKLVKKNSKMLWIEMPTNPLVRYIDIQEASKIAHQYGLIVVVDNTFLSPYFQKPLALRADIVMHSLTKYCNGHSDVIMGAAVTNDEAISKKLKYFQNALKSHPEHCIAKKQSSGWGGMLAFYVKGGLPESTTLVSNLKIFTLAESLGGFESLIEVPSVMTHAMLPPDEKIRLGITDSLIRVSVGLENVDDLINDLENAFEYLGKADK